MAKAETNGTTGEQNSAGVYVHKESGVQIIANSDIQADAFIRLGYEYKGQYDPEADTTTKKGTN